MFTFNEVTPSKAFCCDPLRDSFTANQAEQDILNAPIFCARLGLHPIPLKGMENETDSSKKEIPEREQPMRMITLLWMATGLQAQELTEPIRLIKEVLPQTGQIAILYQKDHGPRPEALNQASALNGVKIFVMPSHTMRDLNSALEGVMQFHPDLVIFLQPDHLGGKNALKYAVKFLRTQNFPLFSDHLETINSGGLGMLAGEERQKKLFISKNAVTLLGLTFAEPSSPQIEWVE